jgi:hypothetical protein
MEHTSSDNLNGVDRSQLEGAWQQGPSEQLTRGEPK